MWKLKSQALVPFALPNHSSNASIGRSLRAGHTISIKVVVPPINAARLAVWLTAFFPTASWVAGIFAIIPALAILQILGSLYSLYLLWAGLEPLMKVPEDKSIAYTVVVVIVAIVMMVVISVVFISRGRDGRGGDASDGSDEREDDGELHHELK